MADAKKAQKKSPKQKRPSIEIVSPKATAAYAWVNKPDSGVSEYSDDKFKITLVYDKEDDISTLEDAAKALAKKAVEEGFFPADVDLDEVRMPFTDGDDKAEKKPEFAGKTLVTAKSKFQPAAVDAKRKKLPKGVTVFSGDLVKALLVAIPYVSTEKVKDPKTKKVETVTAYGVTFQLKGVQLIEKRNNGSDAANAFDEEDGYDGAEHQGSDDDSGDGDDSGGDY